MCSTIMRYAKEKDQPKMNIFVIGITFFFFFRGLYYMNVIKDPVLQYICQGTLTLFSGY